MPKPSRIRYRRGPALLALLSIAPFLVGFEPRREEGYTVGVGGSYGRGHYSPACTHRMYQEEYASGSLSVDYTFHHDSARVLRPQVTLGGRMGIGHVETRLISDPGEDSDWEPVSSPAVRDETGIAQFLLRLEWAYLGLGSGLVLCAPDWKQGSFDAPFFPAGEVRLGPWHRIYMTASVGSGFAVPVTVPIDFALGMGWQGETFGIWLGKAASTYEASDNLMMLSYRFRSFTWIGSLGLLAQDEGSFPGHYEQGQVSRAAMALTFHL